VGGIIGAHTSLRCGERRRKKERNGVYIEGGRNRRRGTTTEKKEGEGIQTGRIKRPTPTFDGDKHDIKPGYKKRRPEIGGESEGGKERGGKYAPDLSNGSRQTRETNE